MLSFRYCLARPRFGSLVLMADLDLQLDLDLIPDPATRQAVVRRTLTHDAISVILTTWTTTTTCPSPSPCPSRPAFRPLRTAEPESDHGRIVRASNECQCLRQASHGLAVDLGFFHAGYLVGLVEPV